MAKVLNKLTVLNFINSLGLYPLEEYKNYSVPIILRDNDNYYYRASFDNLKHGRIPRKFHKSNPYTIQNIRLWLKLNNVPLELVSSLYINSKDNLIFKDKDNYLYLNNISHVIMHDMSSKFHQSNPYTIQNIKLWCTLENKPFELISDVFINSKNKLKWKCLKADCEEIFESTWSDIYSGYGCGVCSGKQVGLSNCLATKNPELALEWHPTKNGNLTPYDVSEYSNKKVWWQCLINPKHEWSVKISSRNKFNTNCPYCSHKLPSNEYNLLVANPILCEEWNYTKNDKLPEEYLPNTKKRVNWICKKCNNEWRSQIANRNNGCGCPECSESKGEKYIVEILKCREITYDTQHMFDDLLSVLRNKLRYDASIFNNKEKDKLIFLIEFDGKQHYEWIKSWMTKEEYERLQYHDKLKNQYCISHNIPLIRIPYWEYDNIETILVDIIVNNNITNKFIIKDI